MLLTTLPLLRCPHINPTNDQCAGELTVKETKEKKGSDILYGTLLCKKCQAPYPILAGVAILVDDVELYLQQHCKGISALVDDSEISDLYIDSYLQAKTEIELGMIEEDLESQRVNALYYMNHYLSAKKSKSNPFWRPKKSHSTEIDRLVKTFWDNNPFSKIAEWTKTSKPQNIIELACGVGGLAQIISKKNNSYLGIDTAFASIALARHIYLRSPYSLSIQIPEDLLAGPLTRKVVLPKVLAAGKIDFVVGDLQSLPVVTGEFDLCVALNAIDMIPEPSELPRMQYELLRDGGVAIQSSPYIWQDFVSKNLRETIPVKIKSSSEAVEYLYSQAGFKIFKKIEHLPWLFLKHFRQIELYSVNMFAGRKK